jgi:hypothetical protein
MTTLARSSLGRILLHLLAVLGDGCVRFHCAGIAREFAGAAAAYGLLLRLRARFIDAILRYLTAPLGHCASASVADPRALAAVLVRGDVLLSDGDTRVAALVKRITRSPWSHVSMYVGPLEDGPDPRCVVEADMAKGVRSIRLSELDALHVRVLRARGLDDGQRSRLVQWVVGRIGSEYDLAHAMVLGRDLLRLPPRRTRSRSASWDIGGNATRFICCTLLAHGFAFIGYPIEPVPARDRLTATTACAPLPPGDFEHAPVFEVLHPTPFGLERGSFRCTVLGR